MRNAGGYSVIVEPGKRNVEHDLATCRHCNRVAFTSPSAHGRAPQIMVMRADGSNILMDYTMCRKCMAFICPVCAKKRECVPFERKLEIVEKAARKMVCS